MKICRDCKEKFSPNTSWLARKQVTCEKCGRKDVKLDCAHVIPRTNKTLRWDPMNALSLCYRCHVRWAHENPLEFTSWFEKYYRGRYTYLMHHKNTLSKRTTEEYQELFKALKEKDMKKLDIKAKRMGL